LKWKIIFSWKLAIYCQMQDVDFEREEYILYLFGKDKQWGNDRINKMTATFIKISDFTQKCCWRNNSCSFGHQNCSSRFKERGCEINSSFSLSIHFQWGQYHVELLIHQFRDQTIPVTVLKLFWRQINELFIQQLLLFIQTNYVE